MRGNEQLRALCRNYKELEDENQDKLLLVGKKLLGIKKLVMNEDAPGKKKDKLTSNDKNHT
ncbi:MAG: hypothetical protein LBK13_09035 [Spirochaetales bacterium]|jgi:hypothetical protein|nr:hypothetical protein [Spirochaetales bacterium]